MVDASTAIAPRPTDVAPSELLTTAQGLSRLAALTPRAPERGPCPPVARASIDRFPTAIARPLAKLDDADATRRLLHADLAIAMALRFVAFAGFAHAGDPARPEDGAKPWIARANKRRLADWIRELPAEGRAPEAFARLAHWVRSDEGRAELDPAIDLLERLEHAPGPLGDHRASVDEATTRVRRCLAGSAWAAGGAQTLGRFDEQTWRFDGYKTQRAAQADAPDGSAWLQLGDARLWLTPWCVPARAAGDVPELLIAVERKDKKRRGLVGLELSMMLLTGRLVIESSALRVEEKPGSPFDVEPRPMR